MAEKVTFRFGHFWAQLGSTFPNFPEFSRINRDQLLPLPYIYKIYPYLSTIAY